MRYPNVTGRIILYDYLFNTELPPVLLKYFQNNAYLLHN